MSKRLIAAIASSAFVSSAFLAVANVALAADMPVQAPVVAPLPSWYGSFVGVHGGYGWGGDPVRFTGATGVLAPDLGTTIPTTLAGRPRGALAGAQWGTNWQSGRWVYGFLSDLSWSDVRDSETVTLAGGPVLGTRTTSADQRMRWFGTSRLRAGYLAGDNLLFYGSGGLASGGIKVTVDDFVPGVACTPGTAACVNGSRSKSRWGWAAGGGLEYGMGSWSVFVDYVHYDLGHLDLNVSDGVNPATLVTSTRFSGDVVRAGINYRFGSTFFDMLTAGAR